MKVHPSALVHPEARIGEGSEIGPYAIVGAEVTIGAGCRVESHAVLEGAVEIGANNFIGHGAVIGAAPQDSSFKSETRSGVRIGDRNTLREHCTVHRGADDGSETIIGHDNFLMAGAHGGHNSRIGDKVIVANNCLLGGYVEVEDGAFLGGGGVFHQHIHVGRLAITQGGSRFSTDIPPFVVAADLNRVRGLNVIGLRRAGFSRHEREQIKRAFRLLYLSGLNVTQALARAREEEWSDLAREFFDFVANAKKRGICAFKRPSSATL